MGAIRPSFGGTTRRRLQTGLLLATLMPLAAWAEGGAMAGNPDHGVRVDPQSWMLRLYQAASDRNYGGTLVVSAQGTMVTSRIIHIRQGQHRYERIDALDGEARSIVRKDDEVHTLWPAAKLAIVEARDARLRFPALQPGGHKRVLASYELRMEAGQGRVAGRAADIAVLKARDDYRYSQKIWADHATGLLLRVEVIDDDDGEVLESSAFSDVSFDVAARPQKVTAVLGQLEGWRVVHPKMTAVDAEQAGVAFDDSLPPGFEQIQCVRRALSPADGAAAQSVVQTVFSDGLTHVSVFVEPAVAAQSRAPGMKSIGATHMLVRQIGAHWVTLVGDVPAATLERFARALKLGA